jgi:hypothetical protein
MPTFKEFVLDHLRNQAGVLEAKARDGISSNVEKIAEIIKNDCQPWLKKSGGFQVFRGINNRDDFIRPVDGEQGQKSFHDMYIGAVRKNRQPKDSPVWLHEALNDYFMKKVGLPLRSTSLFCVRSSASASNYGSVYAVFPIGDFNYSWSKLVTDPTHTFCLGPYQEEVLPEAGPGLNDMIEKQFKLFAKKHSLLTRNGNEITNVQDLIDEDLLSSSRASDAWIQFAKEFIANNDLWLFNSGLKTALTNDEYEYHEIMIVCDKYYLVKFDIVDDVMRLIESKK